MIENAEPLVSIIVITYNSSKYVLETLESARLQTYRNIELIVSDDCSRDNTVEICRNWIEENKDRFVRTELVIVEKNTGISSNCNRGLYASKGEWIKLIAGDDVLINTAIQDFVTFVNSDSSIYFVFGACKFYLDNKILPKIELPDIDFQKLSAEDQYKFLIREGNLMHGPTSFINRNKLIELSGFDESIPFSEDWPLWINATKNHNKLYFIEDTVALYRIHEDGIYSKTKIGLKYDSVLSKNVNLIRKKYLLPNLLKEKLIFDFFHQWIIYNKEIQSSAFSKFIFKSLLLISPVFYINKLNKNK